MLDHKTIFSAGIISHLATFSDLVKQLCFILLASVKMNV